MALKPITADSVSRLTALIIGPAGIGKTSLLRSIPEGERACTLSAEGGLLCVRDLVQAGLVEGFEIRSLADFRDAHAFLMSDQTAKSRYQWIFIDSLTEIAGRCVEHFQAKFPDKGDSYNLWGGYTDAMTGLVKAFRDLQPYNVVFTCLEDKDKDEVNRFYYAPAIAGNQIKSRLTSYFDEVFYMTTFADENGQTYRAFVTQPVDRRPGKDRSGRLDLIEKPDLSWIKTKIMNGDK